MTGDEVEHFRRLVPESALLANLRALPSGTPLREAGDASDAHVGSLIPATLPLAEAHAERAGRALGAPPTPGDWSEPERS